MTTTEPNPSSVTDDASADQLVTRRAVETAIRIGVVGLIGWLCFRAFEPFLVPALWGTMIAVAIHPTHRRLAGVLGGKTTLAAILIALGLLATLVVPSVFLMESLASGVHGLIESFRAGTLIVPSPPGVVKTWPLVGERTYEVWLLASHDPRAALQELAPALDGLGKWLLGVVRSTGAAVVHFTLATVIAAIMLASAERGAQVMRLFATKLSPTHGLSSVVLAERTVRNVAVGVLGVATLQTLLAGVGFLFAGVPAAGLLALVCLVLCVVQVGPLIPMVAAAAYLFYYGDTTTAVVFSVWTLLVGPVDNVLRPILLGRGASVPMLVVFIGAIGGLLQVGLIGMFLGSVMFSLGYQLFRAWLGIPSVEAAAAQAAAGPGEP
jgi:predicted PurR-regulated permease PerM